MDLSNRQARIGKNLGIRPISHGQVHTFQIAVPQSQKQDILLERHQLIEDSFTEYKSNLVPLIVRRTESYSEEEEYEVVYGADWCLVAKELDIEKLWVWVFDMTDEQAAAAKAEMEQLVGSTGPTTSTPPDGTQQINSLLQQLGRSFQERLETLTKKIDQSGIPAITTSSSRLGNISTEDLLEQLEKLIEKKLQPLSKKLEIINHELDELKYAGKTVLDLKKIAKERGLKGYSKMKKEQLITELTKQSER